MHKVQAQWLFGLLTRLFVLLSMTQPASAIADEALVAVATNFAEATEKLKENFEETSGHTLKVVTGSTGHLYAQIVYGAPFDVFLAADAARPRLLEQSGAAIDGTGFVYAVGRLTLWSPGAEPVSLERPVRSLAIANPELAPYGAAARETMQSMRIWDAFKDKIVMGENAGQAFALVATQNAEVGFVALSYVLSSRNTQRGSRWDVPAEYYSPIRQEAVLLQHGYDNPAATEFLAFLQSEPARATIESLGYRVE